MEALSSLLTAANRGGICADCSHRRGLHFPELRQDVMQTIRAISGRSRGCRRTVGARIARMSRRRRAGWSVPVKCRWRSRRRRSRRTELRPIGNMCPAASECWPPVSVRTSQYRPRGGAWARLCRLSGLSSATDESRIGEPDKGIAMATEWRAEARSRPARSRSMPTSLGWVGSHATNLSHTSSRVPSRPMAKGLPNGEGRPQ